MPQSVQMVVFSLAMFFGAAVFVSGQAGLWVSTGSSLTTSGPVTITSAALPALSVTGGTSTTGPITTSGVVTITSGASPALSVTGNISTNGSVVAGNDVTVADDVSVTGDITTQGTFTSTMNTNAFARHTFQNLNAGTGAAAVIDLNGNAATGEMGIGSSTIPGFQNTFFLLGTGTGGVLLQANNTAGPMRYIAGATSTGHTFSGARINSNASQPAFLAYNSVTDLNQNGTVAVDFDTEVYDTGTVFTADNFNAPVTGIYMLCASMTAVETEGGAGAAYEVFINTSNRRYQIGEMDLSPTTGLIYPSEFVVSGCVFADMDALDQAYIHVNTTGSINILGTLAPDLQRAYFSGRLMP